MTDADKREEEVLRNNNRQNTMTIESTEGSGVSQRNMQLGLGSNAPPLELLTDWPDVRSPFRVARDTEGSALLGTQHTDLEGERLDPLPVEGIEPFARGALNHARFKGAVLPQISLGSDSI